MKSVLLNCFIISMILSHSFSQSTTGNESNQKFRLPENLVPEAYNLLINVSMEERDFSIWGTVDITIKCMTPTNAIILHSRDLMIIQDRVTVAGGETVLKITKHEFDVENHLYIITLENQLQANTYYFVRIAFEAPLNFGLTGMYRSSYVDAQSDKLRWYAMTQAEPIHARRIFPCFDELHLKARFTISVGHAKRYVALSNMALDNIRMSNERLDWFVSDFKESVLMAPYLVTIAVFDFQYYENSNPILNIPYRMWARKDVFLQTQFSEEIFRKSLTFFAEYFEGPYEISKLDVVSVPDFQSRGMENYGMLTFGEFDQLFDQTASSITNKVNAALVTAQETSKLWMGNLASFGSWDSIWLKSAFSSFFDKFAVSRFYSDLNLMDVESTNTFISALAADGLKASHKLAFEVQAVEEPVHLFDTIAYQKGSHLIRMLYAIMGEEPFHRAVVEFVDKFKYTVASLDETWQVFNDVAIEANVLPKYVDIKLIMDSWSGKRGYPLLRVTRNFGDKQIIIEQENFVFNAEGDPVEKSCWVVPINFTTSTEANFLDFIPKYWLDCDGPLTFDLEIGENDWILINLQLIALCRIQYDDATWKLIGATLLNPQEYTKIDALSRVHLISDIHGLSWIGKMEYQTALEMLTYLKNEEEYIPWINGFSVLESLRYMLSQTDLIADYLTYASNLMEPKFLSFGKINEYPENDAITIEFKSLFISLACSVGTSDCQEQATSLFKQWIYGVAPDTDNPYLELSINPARIRRSESLRMFSSVIKNDTAVPIVIDFFLKRFDDIYSFHRGDPVAMGQYLLHLYSRIITEDAFNQVQEFVEKVKHRLQAVDIRLKEAVDVARDNILWHKRNFEILKKVIPQINSS